MEEHEGRLAALDRRPDVGGERHPVRDLDPLRPHHRMVVGRESAGSRGSRARGPAVRRPPVPHAGRTDAEPLVHDRRVDAQPLRVIIAEDSALIREGLARLIVDSGGVVVAKVGDGPAIDTSAASP